ncbi:Retinitis pigmentosa 1-like 1 protein [Balamuthia mandrillaris]
MVRKEKAEEEEEAGEEKEEEEEEECEEDEDEEDEWEVGREQRRKMAAKLRRKRHKERQQKEAEGEGEGEGEEQATPPQNQAAAEAEDQQQGEGEQKTKAAEPHGTEDQEEAIVPVSKEEQDEQEKEEEEVEEEGIQEEAKEEEEEEEEDGVGILPPEMLAVIFSYLDSKDLLAISLSNGELRSLALSQLYYFRMPARLSNNAATSLLRRLSSISSSIQVLDFAYCHKLNNKVLGILPSTLRKLVLSHCGNFTAEGFLTLSQQTPALHTFSAEYCRQLDQRLLELLPRGLHTLLLHHCHPDLLQRFGEVVHALPPHLHVFSLGGDPRWHLSMKKAHEDSTFFDEEEFWVPTVNRLCKSLPRTLRSFCLLDCRVGSSFFSSTKVEASLADLPSSLRRLYLLSTIFPCDLATMLKRGLPSSVKEVYILPNYSDRGLPAWLDDVEELNDYFERGGYASRFICLDKRYSPWRQLTPDAL